MPTFSDGDDSVDAATMLTSPVSPGDMRSHLQNLLDDKEKQLLAASGLADVPRIEMPVPPQRVHAPEHTREVADVPASVRPLSFVSGHEHSDDMV